MKNKSKPVIGISNDWHLKLENGEILKDIAVQFCELLRNNHINQAIIAGDIFDSRPGQKVDNLASLDEILDIFNRYKITLWVIPGNHDKQNYDSDKSYLIPYKHYPGVYIVDKAAGIPIGDLAIHLLPFYQESVWLQKLGDLEEYIGDLGDGRKHILVSHQALNGSVNNDGSEVKCNISPTRFIKYHSVLLGHYHNYQQPSSNVYHLPSVIQHNFGEDPNKGFTLLFEDGSFEIVKSKFKEFETVVIDLDVTPKKELDKIAKGFIDCGKNIRLDLIGSSEVVKSVNKDEYVRYGVDVRIKSKEIEQSITYYETEIKEHDHDSIIQEFAEFCEEKEKDFEAGVVYLIKKLKK